MPYKVVQVVNIDTYRREMPQKLWLVNDDTKISDVKWVVLRFMSLATRLTSEVVGC